MTNVVRRVPPLPQTDRGAFCPVTTDAQGERVVYCNGSNVIWRSVAPLLEGKGGETPDSMFCWKNHARRTTCAAISPNGNWVVSGDVTGALRVWGAKGDHLQKNEYKLWDGTIKDVSWSSDSTRLFAAGDGKEVRAAALIWDTGSKTGEVGGHAKQVNSISFRNQRPFSAVTGGEDMLVAFHKGVPFKFSRSHSVHSNFVNCVRYSPDGDWVVSAGSDSKLCLYEGKEGELVREFEKPEGITGSIWQAAWSPDSRRVATAGGDKKLRIWDRESGAQVAEMLIGTGSLDDMQVGVTWPTEGRIISTCLDGRLLLWNVGADGVPTLAAEVDGTQGPLTCVASDPKTGALVYGGSEGAVAVALPDLPPRRLKIGKSVQHVLTHSAAHAGTPEAWVFALDDIVRRYALPSGEALGAPIEVKEFAAGVGWLDSAETKVLVATGKNNLVCITEGGVAWRSSAPLPRRPTALATLPGSRVALALEKPEGSAGGVQSSQFDILLFGVSDTDSAEGLKQEAVLERHLGEVSALRFSPSGEFLASADAANKIFVWNLRAEPIAVQISEWSFHTSRVTCLDWLPCGRRLVSGSLDRHVYVWDADAPSTRVAVMEAHKGGTTGVVAVGDKSFASVGHDGYLTVHSL